MPNLFKAFSRTKAEPYQFPTSEELDERSGVPEEEPEPEVPPGPEEQAEPDLTAGEEEPEGPAEAPLEESLISFAQIQAEKILADARQEAEDLRAKAREEADREAKELFAKVRQEGYQEGFAAGSADAARQAKEAREEQAQRLEEEVHRFLGQASVALDRQMDQSVDDLKDLAMAVAEKVVQISLRSSGDVIARMIQTAVDKRKKKEWVHIYISECDARRMSQIPASLSAALGALSDRVRIIPMADDESGTLIIEMPDEIVDASAATQLGNLRAILTDTANSASGVSFPVNSV